MINFCFDNIINQVEKKIIPNLVAKVDDVSKCSTTWPYCDYPRLLNYFNDENIPYNVFQVDNCPIDSFYFININYFNKHIDWFDIMPTQTRKLLQQNKFKVLFFYCEGDSPSQIKEVLHKYAIKHDILSTQIHFISHSTLADRFKNFYYFNDDEILYKYAQLHNNYQSQWHNKLRNKKFTLLIRRHKDWRLSIATDFWKSKLHLDSYFSYHGIDKKSNKLSNDIMQFTPYANNPLPILKDEDLYEFKKNVPIKIDKNTTDYHDDYESHDSYLYTNSYWNIVLETHINLEGSTGTFITEKTWKPIKHNQPFIIIGTVNSLHHLHNLGYKTFDGIIDESYDYIKSDIERYLAIRNVIHNLASKSSNELQEINQQVKPIVEHNSALFNASKKHRLEE